MKKLWEVCAILSVAALCGGAIAQDKYPDQPIRLIVPFPAGGATDLVSRVVATELGKATGWAIAPDNKPGSGGSVGLSLGGKAKADGYTIVMAQNANLVINPLLGVGNYDPIKDFEPVLLVASSPMVMIVAKNSQYESVEKIIAAAKAKPGSVRFGSPGIGTSGHLAGELLQQLSGAKFLHVPYKGISQALPDLMGGRIDLFVGSAPSVMAQIKEGTLHAVGVFDKKRATDLPDVPTFDELGYSGSEAITWWGVVVPAGTRKEIVDQLNKEINAVLKKQETQAQFKNAGADVLGSSAEEFAGLIQSDVPKWKLVIERADIKKR
ncbi:MAG: tripartite tricarboxylate transporter substrate binding protein [Candidatus Accumulibacter sp.]|jgi:tripartite-type tricarboxylate transporter receptor subunit TctC|nr:tripartite tricarboxylate transporter substrate binding protein [Accumulibacter sp.]